VVVEEVEDFELSSLVFFLFEFLGAVTASKKKYI
jgi:hypothetical protein